MAGRHCGVAGSELSSAGVVPVCRREDATAAVVATTTTISSTLDHDDPAHRRLSCMATTLIGVCVCVAGFFIGLGDGS